MKNQEQEAERKKAIKELREIAGKFQIDDTSKKQRIADNRRAKFLEELAKGCQE